MYVSERALDSQKHSHTAHKGPYSDHTLKFYYGLDAAESTMLLGLRTGKLGLKTHMGYRLVKGFTDSQCQLCEAHLHTAEHRLCHCKKVAEPQIFSWTS